MIEVRVGELAEADVGAVVRPVASDFSPVNPAMRRFDEAAGEAVAGQCARLGDVPVGSAVITSAGSLPAEFIVHVAVRSRSENASGAIVRRGLVNALRRLVDWEIETVAISPLGVGAGNLDAEESAAAMVPVLARHIQDFDRPARVVVVVEDEYQRGAFDDAVAVHAGGERAGTGT